MNPALPMTTSGTPGIWVEANLVGEASTTLQRGAA